MSLKITNINYNDFKNICRTCMCNCDIKFTQDSVISEVFYKLTDMHFETNNELPQQICQKCFEKINEIFEFAFKCKRTNFSLIKCLNNFKNIRINEEQDVVKSTNIQKRHEIKLAGNDELKIKQEIIENINNELNEDIIPETSEFIDVQNMNCSDDDLLKSNTLNINDESITNENLIDKNTNSLNVLNINSERINKKESQYKCDICNKTFKYLKVFSRHKSFPSCERPYECNQCSKAFSQRYHLANHMRSHTGERPYKCDQCAKAFSHTGGLTNHMRTHTGERPYKCEQCSKAFQRKFILKKHMRTHSGERPFKCDQCSKSFLQSAHLTYHLRLHSSERAYKCDDAKNDI